MMHPSVCNHLLCRRCGYPDPDVRLIGCSCLLHVRCTPLSLIIHEGAPYQYGGIPTPVKSSASACPICRTGIVSGIELLHLGTADVEKAVEFRKLAALASSESSVCTTGKRCRDQGEVDDSLHHIDADSAYLLLSHSKSGSKVHHNDRTGRWSVEEVAFVDQVVMAFDKGALPLPHGVKLNEFLGEMLLCKSSRLTKKMKNAKLSARSYTLKNTAPVMTDEDCMMLSALQDNFLKCLTSEPVQLELKFTISKLWRGHFSNLCLQVGYELLDGREWLRSLEEMERRASETDELVRAVRRRRMGLALRQDVGPSSTDGVYVGGLPANRGVIGPTLPLSSDVLVEMTGGSTLRSDELLEADDFLENVMEMEAARGGRARALSEDFFADFEDIEDPLNMVTDPPPQPVNKFGDCGPFLDKVIRYVEKHNIPFEHADVWVASHVPEDQNGDGGSETLRLFHAGHATRSDIDSKICSQLNEFGVYSINFSFAPGVGLPGRVYQAGSCSWESRVDNSDPVRFERAGGAQVYGVKTAVGIPMETAAAGRIVLALYSTKVIEENLQQLEHLASLFANLIPEPKWKLIVELGAADQSNNEKKRNAMANKAADRKFAANNVSSSSLSSQVVAASVPPKVPSPGPTEKDDNNLFREQKEILRAPLSLENLDQCIASILGDHMPLSESPDRPAMLQHFVHLRLLLLRPEDRRSQQENELLDVVKQSFMGYSKDNKRKESELAWLLARDWMFLSSTCQQPLVPTPILQQHQAPLQAPAMPTGALNTGAPGRLIHWRHGSFDEHSVPTSDRLCGSSLSREVSPTIVPDA